MSKKAYYFSHDYNARNDPKLIKVQIKHKMEGVGIYWCIVEMLYEQDGYIENEYERIAFELRTDTNVIQSVINDFGLFKIKGNLFYSESVLTRLELAKSKSIKATESVNKRWEKYERNTNVSKTDTIKESKRKERKENGYTISDYLCLYNRLIGNGIFTERHLVYSKDDFDSWIKLGKTEIDFETAICNALKDDFVKTKRLTPAWLLKPENFEKYLVEINHTEKKLYIDSPFGQQWMTESEYDKVENKKMFKIARVQPPCPR